MDALARALSDLVEQRLRDLVPAEVERAVAKLAPADVGERLFTIPVAAERLGVGQTTLRRYIADGLVKVTLVPGRVPGSSDQRIRGVDLDAFVVGLSGGSGMRPTSAPRTQARKSKRSTSGTPPRLDDLVDQRMKLRARA